MTDDGPLRISDEVRAALSDGRPVVALESTIVTHGMPHPHNLETALSVEQTVRDRGAVPATIAIIEGKLVVGVAGGDLERLAWAGHAAAKASRRDVAAQVATGGTAGTTVATTMLIAAMAGIVETFRDEARQRCGDIVAACTAGDLDQVARQAHPLKSSAAGVGPVVADSCSGSETNQAAAACTAKILRSTVAVEKSPRRCAS